MEVGPSKASDPFSTTSPPATNTPSHSRGRLSQRCRQPSLRLPPNSLLTITPRSISVSYFSFPTYQAYYSALSGVQQPVGSAAGAVGSRLLDRAALTSPGLNTMRNITAGVNGQFIQNNFCLVSGGQVFKDAADPNSGVNPAWRTSYVHNIVSETWPAGSSAAVMAAVHTDITNVRVGAMRAIAPDTGAYMNEADRLDPLFLQDFYGGSLKKLQDVKAKYDPTSVFYCPTCVGSNHWAEDAVGRLCQIS